VLTGCAFHFQVVGFEVSGELQTTPVVFEYHDGQRPHGDLGLAAAKTGKVWSSRFSRFG
jgi:hypothetical protein